MDISTLQYHPHSTAYFERIRALDGCVWLDSGKPASRDGRYDIITALPSHTCDLLDPDKLETHLTQALANNPQTTTLPFSGGWIGYLSYEYLHGRFDIKAVPSLDHSARSRLCPAWFGWYDWAIIQDHKLKQSRLFFTRQCPDTIKQAVMACLQGPPATIKPFKCDEFQPDQSQKHYIDKVKQIQAYIASGDCYQTNYTQRFQARFHGSSASAYLELRKATPNPFSAYIDLPTGESILSLSQESFLRFENRQVTTAPIKGTVARGKTPAHDRQLADSLLQSAKNRAENIMIVDLMRNDFSKNCQLNSVEASGLFDLKTYANVHHLVSRVNGQLRPEVSHCAFLLDCFPGGSITGAPKKRAMELIHELEVSPREIYCGAIGFFSSNQKTDFNISIRTLLHSKNSLYCWAGGGIVFDSKPEEEYRESLQKVRALLNALTQFNHQK